MIPEIKRILYATDLTKNSAYAFFYAADMAKRYNAKIVILHSIEPVGHIYSEGMTDRIEEILQRSKKKERETDIEEIKKSLQEFCKRTETQMGGPCVELVSKILVPLGHSAEEILAVTSVEL